VLTSQMCRSCGVYHHCFPLCMLLHAQPRPVRNCCESHRHLHAQPPAAGDVHACLGGIVLSHVRLAACERALMDMELGCTVTAQATAGGNNHAAIGTGVPPGMHRPQRMWWIHAARSCCLSQTVRQDLRRPRNSRDCHSRPSHPCVVPGNRPRLLASC